MLSILASSKSHSAFHIVQPMKNKVFAYHGQSNKMEIPSVCAVSDRLRAAILTFTEIFYTFRYAEFKGHPNEPWVIRQAGVYQKFDVQNKSSLYILVNAVPNSAAHNRAMQSFADHQLQIKLSPLWLHGVIHASYFASWREYIAEYEKRLLPIVSLDNSIRKRYGVLKISRPIQPSRL
jgi:hypothetical protein